MTIGVKIKKIRIHRGLKQKELGLAIGLPPKSAENRMTQYEIGYRIPKVDMLNQIAEVLHVNPQNFYALAPNSMEAFIYELLWMEEDFPGVIHLFQMRCNPAREAVHHDNIARYDDNDRWPAREPVGVYFDSLLVNEFLQEWLLRKQELDAHEITSNEYLDWKLNWPNTSDGSIGQNCYIAWRENK